MIAAVKKGATRLRRLGRGLTVAAITAVGLGLLPAVRARLKAVAVLAEGIWGTFPRPFAPDVVRRETTLAGILGDVYETGSQSPAILLIPGAAPRGKDDLRAVRLARAIARAGRTVFVPVLDLADRRFAESDLDRIATATIALNDSTDQDVVLLGISYGGSLALIAAADARLDGRIAQVATFGAYFDLVGVIQAVSTGASIVGDQRLEWDPHPRAGEAMFEAALHVARREQRAALEGALTGRVPRSDLSHEARPIYDLVTNEDPGKTFELADQLDPQALAVLARFSPATVADRIDVPVIALHAVDDPITPFGEALRLKRDLEGARVVSVRLFDHVDFEDASILKAIPDLFQVWRFASWVLSAQE